MSEEGPPRVALDGVTKRFGANVAVDDLTLDAEDGQLLVLVGPSGCGKSTVLRVIAGLESPDEGTVRIGGEVVNDVDPKDRDVAMVFQSYALYPHLSVRKNIEFPLRARHVPADERARAVAEVARSLQLEGLLDRRPGQLSGGQRQRVALGRAMVRSPKVFLMDEPLSNLDAQLRLETRAELVELHERLAATFVYVTHDQVEAMTMGDRIAVLRDGVLQQLGPPLEVHDRPANAFVAGFVGSPPMNLWKAELEQVDGRLVGRLPGGEIALGQGSAPNGAAATAGRQVLVGVRPEDLSVAAGGTAGGLAATVTLVESLGHEHHVVARMADGQLAITRVVDRNAVPVLGEAVTLLPRGAVHVFDAADGARVDGL